MTDKSEALVVVERPQSNAIITRDVLNVQSEQRKLLAEYVKKQMVQGTDYGKIPGTDKDTLLKPGAEKLVDLFRCTPKYKLVSKTEDFDRGLFVYMFRVQLYQRDANAVLAEGYGSANSREERYRWRKARRKCPQCSAEAIIAGKAEYGGGWLCFKKKGGCGAKFDANDKSITGQVEGRVENEDVATLANTILKMAKKRALVDGAIALARVSDMFTQDAEDMAPSEDEPPSEPPRQTRRASAAVNDEVQPPSPPVGDVVDVEPQAAQPAAPRASLKDLLDALEVHTKEKGPFNAPKHAQNWCAQIKDAIEELTPAEREVFKRAVKTNTKAADAAGATA